LVFDRQRRQVRIARQISGGAHMFDQAKENLRMKFSRRLYQIVLAGFP